MINEDEAEAFAEILNEETEKHIEIDKYQLYRSCILKEV